MKRTGPPFNNFAISDCFYILGMVSKFGKGHLRINGNQHYRTPLWLYTTCIYIYAMKWKIFVKTVAYKAFAYLKCIHIKIILYFAERNKI